MKTHLVPVCTIPAEISPQALPLGAASIVAAINKSFVDKPLAPAVSVEARLVSIPPEFHLSQEEQSQSIAAQLLELQPAALCFQYDPLYSGRSFHVTSVFSCRKTQKENTRRKGSA